MASICREEEKVTSMATATAMAMVSVSFLIKFSLADLQPVIKYEQL